MWETFIIGLKQIIIHVRFSFGNKLWNLQSNISWFGVKISENHTNLFINYSKTGLSCGFNRGDIFVLTIITLSSKSTFFLAWHNLLSAF